MTALSLARSREAILRMHPCDEAKEWLVELRRVSAPRAYAACERGDWLLWLAAKVWVDRRLVVLAACDCARLALDHVPEGELRPLRAIETAEAWARGEMSEDSVCAAANAAYDAAHVGRYRTADDYAANAATYAARAAYIDGAFPATSAAAFATYAAAGEADATAAPHKRTLAQCAELIRARIPWSEIARALAQSEVCS